MTVIFLLIPLSILIATGFLLAFIWAVRSGQYEDTQTPAMRLLLEEKRRMADPTPPAPQPDGPAQPDSRPTDEQERTRRA
jgi:cbb3-type cytochrome oxidase maturation protein